MGPIKRDLQTHTQGSSKQQQEQKKIYIYLFFFFLFWKRFDDALPASVASIALGLARFRPLQSVSLCRRKFFQEN